MLVFGGVDVQTLEIQTGPSNPFYNENYGTGSRSQKDFGPNLNQDLAVCHGKFL